MKYYNFERLIKKYSTTLKALIPSGKKEIDEYGDYIDTQPVEEILTGAIISMREARVINSNGAYTQQDKALFTLKPLRNALKHAQIIDDDKVYTVENELENGKFTGVWSYGLKFVSAFGKKEDGDGA